MATVVPVRTVCWQVFVVGLSVVCCVADDTVHSAVDNTVQYVPEPPQRALVAASATQSTSENTGLPKTILITDTG